VLGCLLQCFRPALNIAAVLSIRSPSGGGKDWRADRNRRWKCENSSAALQSDHCLWHVLMEEWTEIYEDREKIRSMCKMYGLSKARMDEAWRERKTIMSAIQHAGLLPRDYNCDDRVETTGPDANANNPMVQAAVVTGGLGTNLMHIEASNPKRVRYYLRPFDRNVSGGSNKEVINVSLHPSSVCHWENVFQWPLMVYYSMRKRLELFAYDVTVIANPLHLLLFAEDVHVNEVEQKFVISDWLHFACWESNEGLASVLELRKLAKASLRRLARRLSHGYHEDHSVERKVLMSAIFGKDLEVGQDEEAEECIC